MQEKVVRLEINSPIIIVEDHNPKKFKDNDVVFVDSAQTADISYEEFKELKKKFLS